MAPVELVPTVSLLISSPGSNMAWLRQALAVLGGASSTARSSGGAGRQQQVVRRKFAQPVNPKVVALDWQKEGFHCGQWRRCLARSPAGGALPLVRAPPPVLQQPASARGAFTT